MTYYITNPNRRCATCNGREVLEVDEQKEEVINSSLSQYSDSFICTNQKECWQNVEADNTKIQLGRDGKIKKIEKFGETVVEIHD